MIATRRGLIVLLAIAVLLGAWLAYAVTRTPPTAIDRAIAPGLDIERVTLLSWDRSPAVTITPGQAGAWRWQSGDTSAAADGTAVRDVLAALRAGRWHRRAEASAAGTVRSHLSVKAGPTTRTFGIGQPLEGTEQQWLVVGDDALLVDRWVARALDPDPLALRVRHPVENVAAAQMIAISGGDLNLRLEAAPLHVASPYTLLPRQDALAALARALEALEIVRLSRPARPQDVTLAIHATSELRFAAACPDDATRAWLSSDAGDGCIERAAYDETLRAVAAFGKPPGELAEPRLVPFDVEAVTLADGTKLDVARRPLIAGKPADTATVTQLLAALAAPAQVIAPIATPAKGLLRVTPKGGGEIAIELLGDGRVRRAREPVALQLAPAAYASLNVTASALADRAIWNEEPTTITELTIDSVTYKRGAVLGEWTRTPAGAVDGARLESLVAALAELRRSPDVESLGKQHDVAFVVTPPAGPPIRHHLTVGGPRPGGCMAVSGEGMVSLPTDVCASITALSR